MLLAELYNRVLHLESDGKNEQAAICMMKVGCLISSRCGTEFEGATELRMVTSMATVEHEDHSVEK